MLSEKTLKNNRTFYIIQAAIEYFISLLITDSFLALLITKTGVPDKYAGIVAELTAFTYVVQLFSLFYRKKSNMKKFVVFWNILSQSLFVLLYFIPVFNIPQGFKIAFFVVGFTAGQVIASIVNPFQISWLMKFVPDKSRGRFTANKEMVSLAGGMIFQFVMGSISDHYKEIGKQDIGFMICGITVLVLAICNMTTFLLIKDEDAPKEPGENTGNEALSESLRKFFSNKALLKVVAVEVIWSFSSKLSLAYYGVYKNNVLGFSMKYVAFLSILYAVVRIAFSRLFGSLADKYSWRRMLAICFSVATLAFFINIFTCPANGKVLFAVYYSIYAISMAGINSGLMNIIFDYTEKENRAAALGLKNAISGFFGFLSSFLGSFIMTVVENGGNSIFGIKAYGQQVLSAITFVLCIFLVIYIRKVVPAKQPEKK